jgi:putative ABC transport system permease protein
MTPLLKFITLRHIMVNKARTFLTMIGIALGVALFIAVRLANESILYTFKNTIDAVAGRTTLQITGNDTGLDEALLAVIRSEPGVTAMAPVLQTIAAVEEGRHQATPGAAAGRGGIGGREAPHGPPQMIDEPLLVMGVDPFSEAPFRDYPFSLDQTDQKDPLEFLLDTQTIFLSEVFAKANGYSLGSTIRLLVDDRVHEFTVRGFLRFEGVAQAMQGNFGMMDIATYQWRFGRVGRLDRIDLITQDGVDLPGLIQRLSSKLPEGIVVNRPQQRGSHVQRMLTAFQLNLTALSGITLLVALFLMYNTMTMAVVQRRNEIGVLRCLGVPASTLLRLFIMEAFILGLSGSLLGIPIGQLLAQWTLKAMEETVTSLYTPVIVRAVVMSPAVLTEGLALGCIVSLVAGVVSVREATHVKPREVLHKGSDDTTKAANHGKRFIVGIVLLLMALLLAQLRPMNLGPVFGYASALFLLLGFACLVPSAAIGIHSLIHRLPLSWTSTEFKLASSSLVSALGRSTMAVTAILTGLTMIGGMMIMIKSFRVTVETWIEQTVSADLFVIPAARAVAGLEAKMPEEIVGELRTIPGIQAIDPIQIQQTFWGEESVVLAARDMQVLRDFSHLLMVHGNDRESIQRSLDHGEVLVSEPLALRRRIEANDRLNLSTPTGLVSLTVAGVFYDYTTDGGRILMDKGLFRKHWPEDKITTLGIYLQAGSHLEAVRQDIFQQLGKSHRLSIIPNQELRTRILNIFDQTFAITYALELIAVVVAILGVTNTLLTTILERKRELAILRVLGATQTQLRKIVLFEALLISLLGITLSLAASFLLSQILIHVINKQSFGWTILFHPAWTGLAQASLFVLLASLLGACLPAVRASKIRLTEALQYE